MEQGYNDGISGGANPAPRLTFPRADDIRRNYPVI